MEIKRYKYPYENSYDYSLEQDNKILSITFGGNLDLYWILTIKDEEDENPDFELDKENYNYIYREVKGTFTITKENYLIYLLFDKLYNDLKTCQLFKSNHQSENSEFFYQDTTEEEYCTKQNNQYKNSPQYKKLYNGETITWYSDDYDLCTADYVTIKKVNDTYELQFTRPKITEENFTMRRKNTITIRFRNSGSRYDPFNIIFMRMYNELQQYDPNFHQLHLEELSYQKKLKRGK